MPTNVQPPLPPPPAGYASWDTYYADSYYRVERERADRLARIAAGLPVPVEITPPSELPTHAELREDFRRRGWPIMKRKDDK